MTTFLFKLTHFFALIFIAISTSFAATFPHGCEVVGFGYSDNFLILNEKGEQTLYLIQNRSDKAIALEHYETSDAFMSPKLYSKLEPMNWSAFASDVENMHFKCSTDEGDSTTIVNCSDVLDVCQYPRVKYAVSNMGNYWISTNKPQGHVIQDAVAKGILLRW